MTTVKAGNWPEIISIARDKYPEVVFKDDSWRSLSKSQMDSIGRYNSRCFEQQNHYVYTNLSFEKTSVEIDSVLVDWIHQYVRLKDLRYKEK